MSIIATLKRSIGRLHKWAIAIYFDARLGVQTKSVKRQGPSSRNSDGVRLSPVSYVCLQRLRRFFIARGLTRGTFVDFGCGSGRVLAFMASLPFDRLVGIELDPEAFALAQSNIRTPNIDVRLSDAADYEFSGAEAVLFFFNPFGATTLRTVIERAPRSATIAFVNMQEVQRAVVQELFPDHAVSVHDWNPTTTIFSPRAELVRV